MSTDVGDVNVRSRDISSPGTLLIRPKGPWSIVLSNSDNFFVGSIVLIFSDGEVCFAEMKELHVLISLRI